VSDHGESLGGALALYIAAHSAYRAHLRAVISDSAFSSYRLIAREKFAAFWPTWLFQWPLSWTVSDVYSPLSAILKMNPIPVLIVHGDRDRIVPVHHALRIYDKTLGCPHLLLIKDVKNQFVMVDSPSLLGIASNSVRCTPPNSLAHCLHSLFASVEPPLKNESSNDGLFDRNHPT
jgi:prolyl oligopeptidase family protein